jgi:hypothetical protein
MGERHPGTEYSFVFYFVENNDAAAQSAKALSRPGESRIELS